jgi:RNA polymerase sigma-70 factor (ECF subfamily)
MICRVGARSKAIRVWRKTCHTEGMREIDEPELIALGKRGDKAAITELFERHYPSSLSVARRILRSNEESQDAVQSAYLSAFRHLHSFRGDAAFKTWITRIVTNHCLMRLRQPWLRSMDLDTLAANGGWSRLTSPEPTPEASAFCREIASALAAAAASLPKPLSDVFQLYAFSGLSLRQIAVAMGLTLPAAKSRLFRANARMRKRLQPVWSDVRGATARRNSPNPGSWEVRSEAA